MLCCAVLSLGAYHNNRMNQLIHVVFVPCIIWSAMVVFSYLSLDTALGHHVFLFGSKAAVSHPWLQVINDNIVLGGGLALFFAYSIYYLTLGGAPAYTYQTMLFAMLLSSGYFFQHVPNAWSYALALHVLAWYMQIHPGHAIFEKRAAALTDNFFGGLALGPLFAWYEVLFTLGWNPQLRARLQTVVDKKIADWKASQKSEGKSVKGH